MNMRIGAFEIEELLPDLYQPHALAMLRPWIDVGNVGSTAMMLLEEHLGAKPLGKVAKPGNCFDFTRYRPVTRFVKGQSKVEIPNSFIKYARQPGGNDFLFLHLLEPHMLGEAYTDSVMKVLQKFGVKRYCLIGSMYDAVPHTKPLIISGRTAGAAREELRKLGVQSSGYEGPTTIVILISQQAPEYNIDVISLIVHLPQYVGIETDYTGAWRLMELLCSLYHLPIDLEAVRQKGEKQYGEVSLAMEREPQLKQAVQPLENYYGARAEEVEEEQSKLSPEIEEFLRDITKRFGQGQG